MINLYKSHSKKYFLNLFTENHLVKTLLVFTSVLFAFAANGAGPVQNATVPSNNGIFSVNYSFQNNLCANENLGTITINTINSTNFAGYSYKWLDNISKITNNRTGLPGDTNPYEVEITDLSNPSIKDILKIFISSPPSIAISKGSLIRTQCSGSPNGQTNISVTGGTPFTTGDPYTYSWVKKGTTSPIISTSINFTGVAGSYRIKVKDVNGCESNEDYDIEDAPVYIVKPTVKVDNIEFGQNNGKITLDISGGTPFLSTNPYTYEWSFNGVVNPSFSGSQQSNLSSGIYKIIVKDANGCSAPVQTVNIEPLALLTINPTPQNSTCKSSPNGNINLNITGGKFPMKITWSDGMVITGVIGNYIRPNLDKGTYSGEIIDALGAKRSFGPIAIDAPELFVFPPISSTNNKCFLDNNGTITISNVSGGIAPYSYILNGGTPVTFTGNSVVISNLASGSYIVTIKDKGTCANTPSQSVDILPLKELRYQKIPKVDEVTCLDDKSGAITVYIEGGQPPYLYKWSNDANLNSAINPNLSAGNYTLQVTDSYGCVFDPLAIVVGTQTTAVSLTSGPQTNNVCFNDKTGSATFTLSGGTLPYTSTWTYEGKPIALTNTDPSPTKITVKNLSSGKYTLMVSDQKGCISPTLITDITPFKIYTNPSITPITCGGKDDATIEVKPSGGTPAGYSTTWSSTQFTTPQTNKTKIGPLTPGTYKLEILNGICTFDTTFVINQAIPIIEVERIMEKANVCVPDSANGSARIKVKGGVPPYTSFQFSIMDPVTGLPVALAPTVIDPNFPDVAINNTLLPGTYFLTVTDQFSCPSVLPQFTILPNNCDPGNDKIIVDPLMSPNGDGQGNEFFYINKIEDYPENEVVIYNRWGMEVFTIRGYDNKDRVFTGLANSALTNRNEVLVDGVYYYTIRSVMDKKQKVNKGYIIIKR